MHKLGYFSERRGNAVNREFFQIEKTYVAAIKEPVSIMRALQVISRFATDVDSPPKLFQQSQDKGTQHRR